ncbi:MAG: YMGG-like glycine zipper-containing protein, partial [Pseudomonadota bacterium]
MKAAILNGIRATLALVAGTLLLFACASVPSGPGVLVLPGTGKNFDQFRADDADCRQYANLQVGGDTPNQIAGDSVAKSAALGTSVGALAGAAIGGKEGAGVGAGTGLAVGALAGTG